MVDRKKVILITGAGGKMKQFTAPKQELKMYAKMNNMDFKFFDLDKRGTTIFEFQSSKFWAIEQVYKDYDYVIWVDYDVRVYGYEINIMNHIDMTKQLNMAGHYIRTADLKTNIKYLFRKSFVINSGVFVLNTIEKRDTYVFLATMRYLTNKFKDTNWCDNNAFLCYLGKNQIIKKFHKIDFKLPVYKNQDKINIISDWFNHMPDISSHQTFVVFKHYAGVQNREEYLK